MNQIEPSDRQTTSLGELSGLPSKRSAITVMRAVVLGAGDPAGAVLAAEQAPLAVAGVAVGEVRRLAEHADRPGLLLPLHDPVVGDVAEQDVAAVAEPDRPLGPAEAGGQPLDLGRLMPVAGERWVDDLDERVGVALAGLPVGAGRSGQRRRRADAAARVRTRRRWSSMPAVLARAPARVNGSPDSPGAARGPRAGHAGVGALGSSRRSAGVGCAGVPARSAGVG